MSEKREEDLRRDMKEALARMRVEFGKVGKDLAVVSKTMVKATGKFVHDVSPKVSATISEGLDQSSEAFHKTMTTVGNETKQFQISFLKRYRTVLAKQTEFIENRLKELTR